MIGTQDLLIGLVLTLFFFGAKRLPEMAHSLGKSMKEFKEAVSADNEKSSSESSAAGSAVITPPASQPKCASCDGMLELGWAHCPHCGAPASLRA
jgi:sec-independent protein translocase protein TatA